MKNCIILGSGRSGTSMVAGTLADAGYYMGDTMLEATEANPKGYFESREVETVNDRLIRSMLLPTRQERLFQWLKPLPDQPNFSNGYAWARSHWLALIPLSRKPYVKSRDIEDIQTLVSHAPYCFKDPRFCYTLPVWQPYLKNVAYICVFRDPGVTAASILKEVQREEYLKGITYTLEQALSMWTFSYQHILEKHRSHGEWLFLHYNQVLTPDGLNRIERFVDIPVNRTFPDETLRRTHAKVKIPSLTAHIYRQLCQLAGVDYDT